MKKSILMVWALWSIFAVTGVQARQIPAEDIALRSGGATSFGSIDAKVVKFGGYSTPECKLAISLDGRYFYLKAMHSTCWKGKSSSGKKIICNSNKSVCKTRSELIDYVRTGSHSVEPGTKKQQRYNSANAYKIPQKYYVYTSSGCALLSPYSLTGGESIAWSGACVGGFLDGPGTLQWYKHGNPTGTSEYLWLSKGVYATTEKIRSWYNYALQNTSDKSCKFVFANIYASQKSPIRKYLYADFKGGCNNHGQNRVNIYLNRKLFAQYKGLIVKHGLPVLGELRFMNGDVYQMGKRPPYYAILTEDIIDAWTDGIHLIRHNRGNSVSPDLFDFRLGFNTDIAPVNVDDHKVLGLNLHLSSSSNLITLNYDIRVKDISALYHKRYIIDLQIKIKYNKTSVAFGFGTKSKKVYYEELSVTLDRANGYHATGNKDLKKFDTYIQALGSSISLSNFQPDVKIISIRGE